MNSPASSKPQSTLATALQSLWQDVLGALWRLGPGNPIANRTLSTAGKRTRHLYIRLGYVGVLLLITGLNFMQVAGKNAGLADLAKLNSNTFALVSFAQLLMMCLLAPVFAAGAVAQQRDAETFNVLLTTPLTNGQIVLGTLLGRFFFVLALLVSGLPVFLLTMLYGGVTSTEIVLSFSLAASAGLMMASIAICVGMFGVGTRQGVFSFYIMIGLYLAAGLALAQFFPLAEAPKVAMGARMTMNIEQMPVFAWAHPILALMAVLGITPAPSPDAVVGMAWPMPFLLSRPAEGFISVALLSSALLNILAMFAVRRPTRMGEPSLVGAMLDRLLPARIKTGQERRRRARHVWANPVAWREAIARANTTSQRAMRWFLFVAGTAAAIWLLIYWFNIPAKARVGPTLLTMQNILAATLIIEAVVAMVAAASAAGTSIARDRENGTFELMQTTPLTSHYILAGKLRGLVTLAAPLLVIPTLTAMLFVIGGVLSPSKEQLINPVSIIAIPIVLLSHIAVVAIIGMHISLRQINTTKAVLMSVGTVLLVYLPLTMACYSVGAGVSFFSGLNPVLYILTCIHAEQMVGTSTYGAWGQAVWLLMIAVISSAAILVGVWQGYRSMVKNFDFTLRRQT